MRYQSWSSTAATTSQMLAVLVSVSSRLKQNGQHFEMHFLNENEISSWSFIWRQVRSGSYNGLVQNRQQTITWTNMGQHLWHNIRSLEHNESSGGIEHTKKYFTNSGLSKMTTILQTTLSDEFSIMKIIVFGSNTFQRIQLKTSQDWIRQWLGFEQATSHYLNPWPPRQLIRIWIRTVKIITLPRILNVTFWSSSRCVFFDCNVQ